MKTTPKTKNTNKTPKLCFPEFEGAWEKNTLGCIADIVGGGTPETIVKEYWEGDIQWFTPTEIKSKHVFKSKRTITKKGLRNSSAKLLPKGTVLFSSRATVGDVAISLGECTTNQGFQSFIVKQAHSNEFLYYWILTNKKLFIRYSSGSTFLEISKSEILKIEIEIPFFIEQQKIAEFLSAVDNKIQKLTKKKSLLEQYKKGVMQKIFKQEIRFKDDNGNDYPDWEEKKLGEVLKTEIREIEKPENNYLAIGIRCHCKGTFQKPNFNPDTIAMDKLYVVKENDLIVNITFAWEGAIALVKKEDEGGLVSHRFPTYVFNRQEAIHEFFQYSFIQKRFRSLLDLISPGGAGRNRVMSKKDFIKLKWSFPRVKEQNKIANFLMDIDKKIEHVTKQIGQAQTFKKGLLQQMFV